MKVSIVTVCFNSASTIGETIESVASQNFTNIEYVIVDGKSNDGTLNIINDSLQKLPKNTLVISENDRGIYDAMNKGLAKSSGDVVGFLNSDDVFADPNAIDLIAKTFEESDAAIVYGNIVYTASNDLASVTRYWRASHPPASGMRFGWHPPHPAFYVKRDVLIKYGGFNLDFKIAGDYEMMVRLITKFGLKAAWCDHLIVRMREGGASNAGISAIWNANRECWKAWEVNGLKPSLALLIGKLSWKAYQRLGPKK